MRAVVSLLVAGLCLFVLASCQPVPPVYDALDKSVSRTDNSSGNGGFDQFGYNYTARVFVGPADGVDRILDGAVWGDPKYANDHLVMKWSKGWDDARFHGEPWTTDAWEDNEWNGKVEGGSGEVAHYKIIWVGGPKPEDSPYWREGGYAIWGQFEVILDQGVIDREHYWLAHARPTGYGPN